MLFHQVNLTKKAMKWHGNGTLIIFMLKKFRYSSFFLFALVNRMIHPTRFMACENLLSLRIVEFNVRLCLKPKMTCKFQVERFALQVPRKDEIDRAAPFDLRLSISILK